MAIIMYLSADDYIEDNAGIIYTINNTLLNQPSVTVIAASGHYNYWETEGRTTQGSVYVIGYQSCTSDPKKVCYISHRVTITNHRNFSNS